MVTRHLSKLLREPYWLVLLGLLALGVVLGIWLARQQTDTEPAVFGLAWRGDPNETRYVLSALFGIQTTVLTVVLSLNAPVIQSAANQYSPRLVPIYLKSAPLRRAIPLFALSIGYIRQRPRRPGARALPPPAHRGGARQRDIPGRAAHDRRTYAGPLAP